MIKSKRNRMARIIFNLYIDKQLRKYFSNFYLCNELPIKFSRESVLITPNHISWWDGFFIDYFLRQETKLDLNIMMLESQLKIYWFFKYLGAYSIEPDKFLSIKSSISYTKSLLSQKDNAVVVYPQGAIEPFEKRPLTIKKGIRSIVRSTNNILVVPIGFKILYQEQKLPAVFTRIGNPIESKLIEKNFELFENTFYDNLDQLSIASNNKKFLWDYFDR